VVTDRDRAVVAWVAVIGAVSAQDVMARFGVGRTVGYRRLARLVEHGLLTCSRPVYGQPALYTATREGIVWAGLPQLDPAHVGVATTRHWALCAGLAVKLERSERVEVWGEPRLRAAELDAGQAVASALLGDLPDGRPRLRRPDLVLFPDAALPVAVEGELSVKGSPAVAGDLQGVGALPDRLGGPLLRAAAGCACRFPRHFGRASARPHSNSASRGRLEGGL
jgi:transposase